MVLTTQHTIQATQTTQLTTKQTITSTTPPQQHARWLKKVASLRPTPRLMLGGTGGTRHDPYPKRRACVPPTIIHSLPEWPVHDLRAWFYRKRWGVALRRFSLLVPRKRRTAVLREGRRRGWHPPPLLGEMKSGVFLSAPPNLSGPTPRTATATTTTIKQTTLGAQTH